MPCMRSAGTVAGAAANDAPPTEPVTMAKGREIAAALDLRGVMRGIVRDNPSARFINDDPPIIEFKDFMTPDECERFKEAGLPTLEPSTGTGALKNGVFERAITSGRTSWNAWCMGECAVDPVVGVVDARIANVTGFSYKNMEYYQILRYETSQEYQAHTDWINEQAAQNSGPRVWTFFLYLNDVAEGGGGATWFPQATINRTVAPDSGGPAPAPGTVVDSPFQPSEFADGMSELFSYYANYNTEQGREYGRCARKVNRKFIVTMHECRLPISFARAMIEVSSHAPAFAATQIYGATIQKIRGGRGARPPTTGLRHHVAECRP